MGEVLYAYAEGPDNGAPLILMHGVTGNRESFNPILPYLIEHYHLYAVDHRGHGQTSHHSGDYHVEIMAEDAARFFREVIDEKAFVLGHSMGARIALQLAAKHGDLTRAIILEDPPLAYGPSLELSRLIFEYWLELINDGLTGEAMIQELAVGNNKDDYEYLRHKAQTLEQLDPNVIEIHLEAKLWSGDNWRTSLAQVRCPAFLIQADTECGGVVDEDLTQIPELQGSNWSWKRIEGVGHSIHKEIPEAFASDVRAFLEKQD